MATGVPAHVENHDVKFHQEALRKLYAGVLLKEGIKQAADHIW